MQKMSFHRQTRYVGLPHRLPNSPPITRFIGEAERTLQALLQRQLEKAGMSFPEWVALTVLSGN